MYAIIITGGKQYRVQEGETITVEKLAGEPGEPIIFDQVLLLGEGDSVQVGDPLIANAQVRGEVVLQGRGKKIRTIKLKRRKHFMKRLGHRQYYTSVKIQDVQGGGKLTATASEPAAASEASVIASEAKQSTSGGKETNTGE